MMPVAMRRGGRAEKLVVFFRAELGRHRLPGGGKFEPVIRLAQAIGVDGRAPFRGLDQMAGNEAGFEIVKERLDLDEEPARDVFRRRRDFAEVRVIFVQKFMVESRVQDLFHPRLDFADVDQHPVLWVDLAAEDKIGDVISAGAVLGRAFLAESGEVFRR